MTLLAERRRDAELIDAPSLIREDLELSLRQIAAVNRWLGGERSLRRCLSQLRSEDIQLLDVGTGNASLLRRLLSWARRGGGRWQAVGLDSHPQVISIARREAQSGDEVPLVRADALALPFRGGSFDVALCTLTLHHFSDEQATSLVSELARVARRLVLVSDLERTPIAYLSARALAATWWRSNPLTRSDGPLSVLRSYTQDELRDIGKGSGLRDVRVSRHFPYRLMLEGRP